MYLIETCNRVWVGEDLSDLFPIRNGLKQGDALSPLLFNFALEYAIRRVQINQDDLKLNSTHQLFVCTNDVNILGGSIHTTKKNTYTSVVASKENRLEVNVDKTMHMLISRDQNAARSHNIKIEDNSFERVEQVKYIGTTLTDQNSIQGEIKSRLKSGDASYHSVQNLLPSSLLSRNSKIKIYGNIILHVVLYGCETWSLILREERRLRMFENRVLRREFWPKRDEVTGDGKNYIMGNLMICIPHPILFT